MIIVWKTENTHSHNDMFDKKSNSSSIMTSVWPVCLKHQGDGDDRELNYYYLIKQIGLKVEHQNCYLCWNEHYKHINSDN